MTRWLGGLVILQALIAVLFAPSCAHAQVSCSATPGTLAFGNVNAFAKAAAYASTNVTVNCVNPTAKPVTVYACLSVGTGSGGGSVTARKLAAQKPGLTLPVMLLPNASAGQQIGDGTANSPSGPIAISVPARGGGGGSFPLTGVIPAQPKPLRAGSYSSTFTGSDFTVTTATAASANCTQVAAAGTRTSSTLNAKANVAMNCYITVNGGDNNLAFPTATLLPGSSVPTSSASVPIEIDCDGSTSVTVALDNGLLGTGPTARYMSSGSYRVQYGIYQDSNHTTPWGNTAGTEEVLAITDDNGDSDTETAYGYVPSQTGMGAGTYSDTVTVTITY